MSEFQRISIEQAVSLIEQGAAVADIRDEQSFLQAHIPGAFHLTNASLNRFVAVHGFDKPVVVVCYHGNSSQGAAQYLAQQGFDAVYSMDGGFEHWRGRYPSATGTDADA